MGIQERGRGREGGEEKEKEKERGRGRGEEEGEVGVQAPDLQSLHSTHKHSGLLLCFALDRAPEQALIRDQKEKKKHFKHPLRL